MAGALTLTALCAALGFLSFVPTAYLGLAELGIISAFGMLVAWVASLTLLPALLRLMPLEAAPATDRPSLLLPIERHSRSILAVAAIAGIASLFALPYLAFDFDPLNLKDPTAESVVTFHLLKTDADTSPHVIEILEPSLEQADRTAQKLASLAPVASARTISSLVPDHQDEKLELIDSLAWLIGPLLQPGESAALDAGQRAQALADLERILDQALARDGAERNPGAAALADALRRLAATPGATAELETRLMGLLPVLLEDLRRALRPIGSASRTCPKRSAPSGSPPMARPASWCAPPGRSRTTTSCAPSPRRSWPRCPMRPARRSWWSRAAGPWCRPSSRPRRWPWC